MSRVFHKHFTVFSIVTIVAALVAAYAIKQALSLRLSTCVELEYFTILPLFVLTILQLMRTNRTQQASNIKELLNEFRREGDLYATYFDLIYRFDNKLYSEVKTLAEPVIQELKRRHPGKSWHEIVEIERPGLDCLEQVQAGREVGRRLYWPALFAYSQEEFRLDSLLDYLNAVGFYHWEGLVAMRDISSILGDYLAVVLDREIVKEYLRFCEEEWEYDETIGAADPYPYLRVLLDDFGRYNKEQAKKRETGRLRRRISQINGSRGG